MVAGGIPTRWREAVALTDISYRRVGWKYVLEKGVRIILPSALWGGVYDSSYLGLGGSLLVIKSGYAWDGASGANRGHEGHDVPDSGPRRPVPANTARNPTSRVSQGSG